MKINTDIEIIRNLSDSLKNFHNQIIDLCHADVDISNLNEQKVNTFLEIKRRMWSFTPDGRNHDWLCNCIDNLIYCISILSDYQNVLFDSDSTSGTNKLNAGTGVFSNAQKQAAISRAQGKSFDSNGDPIDLEDRSSWHYGHYTAFEARHLESFATLINLNQEQLTALINSENLIEVQNSKVNMNHSKEEIEFSESMREILMKFIRKLPKETSIRFHVEDDNNIIYRAYGQNILLTPSLLEQLSNERAEKAMKFDKRLKK